MSRPSKPVTIERRLWRLEDLEYRSGRRSFDALLVPYDVDSAPIIERGRRFIEIADRGSFARTIDALNRRSDRLPLLLHHNPARVAGSATSLAEDARGVVGSFDLVDTTDGREAVELLEVRAVRPSVGMDVRGDRWPTDGRRHLTEVRLAELSLVAAPAHATEVLAVRDAQPEPWRLQLARRRLALRRTP